MSSFVLFFPRFLLYQHTPGMVNNLAVTRVHQGQWAVPKNSIPWGYYAWRESCLFVTTNSVLWYFRFKRGHFSVLQIGVPKIFSYSNTLTTRKTHSSRCLWSARFSITLPGAHPFPCTEESISDCHGWACGTFTILKLLSLY